MESSAENAFSPPALSLSLFSMRFTSKIIIKKQTIEAEDETLPYFYICTYPDVGVIHVYHQALKHHASLCSDI